MCQSLFFNKVADLACNFIKKETLAQVFSCEFYKISKNTFSYRTPPVAAFTLPVDDIQILVYCTNILCTYCGQNLKCKRKLFWLLRLDNIKTETKVKVINDNLIRFHLKLDICRDQTYDRASDMMGKNFGAAKQVTNKQPKAVTIHYHGHSFSLALKSPTSNCNFLTLTMGTVGEICVLIKFFPKREKLLGKITKNIEDKLVEKLQKVVNYSKLNEFFVTRSCYLLPEKYQ